MNRLSKYKYILLYLVVFTLPMYMRLNNILLTVFLLLALIDTFFIQRQGSFRDVLLRGWPVLGFFLLAVLASFHIWDFASFKLLEKHWSLLLIPIAMLSDREMFNRHREQIFMSLVLGCVITLLICYGNLAYEMIKEREPITYFFRWRHVGHQFTEIADTHPTYLGIFIVSSILFLIQDTSWPRALKVAIVLFLTLGLFQLASRMALLLFVLFFLFLLISKYYKHKWHIHALVIGILTVSALFIFIGSRYMEDRIFSKEAILDSKRVERWEVSYEIFTEYPATGVGFEKVKELRKEKYLERDLSISAATEYNAHNQFLDYLSTNGALGGFIYVVALAFLLLLSIIRRDALFTFIFLIFIFSNLTESTMVRIKGIEFFAIFATLFLCGDFSSPKEDEYIYNT